MLARSRLVAAVLTGTLGRSRVWVYHSWQAGSVDVRAVDGQPIWLSTDGEVATAETGQLGVNARVVVALSDALVLVRRLARLDRA